MTTIFLKDGKETKTVKVQKMLNGKLQDFEKQVPFDVKYYITILTKTQHDALYAAHKEKNLDKLSEAWGINCVNHKIIGSTDNNDDNLNIGFKITPYMDYFTRNNDGKEVKYYRDYTTTLEKQKSSSWLINICEESRTSWKSLMIALGKPKYILIWWDFPEKQYGYVR